MEDHSKTSVTRGRGQHGEAQDSGKWLVLVSSEQCYVRPGSHGSLPATHATSPVCHLEILAIPGLFWSPLAEMSPSWAAQRLRKPPPDKRCWSLSQKEL